MSDLSANSVADALAPLLPKRTGNQGLLDDETMGRLQTSWQELAGLGFEVSVSTDELVVRHRTSGFKNVIRLSRPDDLGELRGLFLSLRRHFGRLYQLHRRQSAGDITDRRILVAHRGGVHRS